MSPQPSTPPSPQQPPDQGDDSSLREWTIGVCVTLLSLFASWVVFGEDLTHLLSAPGGPTSAAQPATTSAPSRPLSKTGD